MPKQVWQSDDGRVFDSEEACLQHENQDKLLRPLFSADDNRLKKFVSESALDSLHDELMEIWTEIDERRYLAGNVADVLLSLHQSPRCRNLGCLQSWAEALKVLGSYLEHKAAVQVLE